MKLHALSALVLASVIVAAAPARAADKSEAAFAALKKDVDALRGDAEKRRFRHNYENLIVRLEAAAKKHRGASRGDDCAFVAAQLQAELATVSRLSVDRDAAVDAFATMAERYPSSNLRDDALVAAARLTNDLVRGRAFVDAALAIKGADKKAEAAELKKARFDDDAVGAARKLAAEKATARQDAARRSAERKEAERKDDARRAELEARPGDDDDASAPPATRPSPKDAPAQEPQGAKATAASPSMASAFARLQGEDAPAATSAAKSPSPTATTAPATASPPPAATPAAARRADAPVPPLVDDAAHGAPTMRLDHADAARVTMRPVAVLPETPPPGTPARKVMVIRHEKTAGESLIRLRISGDVGVLRGEVPASNSGVGRRIFYDVAPARLGQRNIQPIEVHDGVVARVRAGQYDDDVVRLVIELEGAREPVLSVTRRPFELVLTTPVPVRADVVAGVAPPPAPMAVAPNPDEVKERIGAGMDKPGAPGGVSISQQLGLKVHRVVIDPGHGGHDAGAIGPTGVREKDITLQIAQRVREKLQAELPDVEVIMTRDDDRTLALQDRTNTANAAAADLFISIHCNASPSRRVRGVETYYLNITSDRYAMKLAARENAELSEGSISDLDFILADLAMKSNVDDSVRLGRSVQKAVVTKLHQTWPDVPDLGLKHALFYVLMGNRMPSILVETSFLSNRQEEKRLSSPQYQDSVANGVVAGVRAFVEERQAYMATPGAP